MTKLSLTVLVLSLLALGGAASAESGSCSNCTPQSVRGTPFNLTIDGCDDAPWAFAASAGFGQQSTCNAAASCGPYGSISCQGTTSCSAVDRNCPHPGAVTCDGTTTYCQSCTLQDHCDECAASPPTQCFSCCRCNGGTPLGCAEECSGG